MYPAALIAGAHTDRLRPGKLANDCGLIGFQAPPPAAPASSEGVALQVPVRALRVLPRQAPASRLEFRPWRRRNQRDDRRGEQGLHGAPLTMIPRPRPTAKTNTSAIKGIKASKSVARINLAFMNT